MEDYCRICQKSAEAKKIQPVCEMQARWKNVQDTYKEMQKTKYPIPEKLPFGVSPESIQEERLEILVAGLLNALVTIKENVKTRVCYLFKA